MLDLGLARGFQHIEGAHQIGVYIGARIFKAVTHTGLGGEMDDDIRLAIRHGTSKCLSVLKHADMGTKAVCGLEHGMTLLLEAHIVISCHAVKTHDKMTIGDQPPGKVKADKAGRAGDQKTHDPSVLLVPAKGIRGSKPQRQSHGPIPIWSSAAFNNMIRIPIALKSA